MFNRVIAGFDGFDGGRDAIALAAALRPKHLTVLMAYGPQMSVAPPTIDRHWDALVPDAERYVATASAEAGRDDAETRIVNASSAAQALQQAAIDEDADLLVIGSAHHGPLGRLLVGDVGAAVLQGAPCPVAVAPKRLRPGWRPERIGVGYDGRSESRAALAAAADLAIDLGCTLTIGTAWQEPAYTALGYPAEIQEISAEIQSHAQQLLDSAVASADVASIEGRLMHGGAADALRDLSEEVDLMIVGSRSYGAPLGVLLGSTAHRLVRDARCPVIVVPRGTREPADPVTSRERAKVPS